MVFVQYIAKTCHLNYELYYSRILVDNISILQVLYFIYLQIILISFIHF